MYISPQTPFIRYGGKTYYEGYWQGKHFRLTDVDPVEYVDFVVITLPDVSRYHQSSVWDDNDTITPEILDRNNVNVAASSLAFDGSQFVSPPFNHETAGQRCKVTLLPGTTGPLHLQYRHTKGYFCFNDSPVNWENFTGKRTDREYFRRPTGEGTWQLLLPNAPVPLQVRRGRFWYDAPPGGLGPEYAGYQIRPKTPPSSPCLARWESEFGESDFFGYIV